MSDPDRRGCVLPTAMGSPSVTASASVVIPAHNEATVIERCLGTIRSGVGAAEVEIVVVCNGCTDDTAAVAARVPGVTVAEIPESSKVAALNEGDRIARHYPRVYLDADVVLQPESLRLLVAALRGGAVAAAPVPVVDSRGCSLGSRMYFRVWARLGYARRHVLGSGVYALSESGRGRFGAFPDVIADDGFVYAQFSSEERVNPSGATFVIRAPRSIAATLRRRVRIHEGNQQLRVLGVPRQAVPGPSWLGILAREPWLLPSVLIFLYVNFRAARIAAGRAATGETGSWNRDDSTRTAVRG